MAASIANELIILTHISSPEMTNSGYHVVTLYYDFDSHLLTGDDERS